ncbi:MerR family transcriptional regulator [Nocardioides speluncae]|uniref:MerR family transcriptional regulator n=1 Tax=Nocardioides speluncae TaxID=2670337 RepID=UPI000D68D582|nr:MerR family transcriptional regulator [Nocardioides speluncae]
MRISQLSERAGLPVGTVKFYLRSGLLPAGRATSATQAEYDQGHLDRLRLVRALLEVGGLSHAEIQRVLDAIDLPTDSTGETLEMVNEATAKRFDGDSTIDTSEAERLVEELGWRIGEPSPHLAGLARALNAAAGLGLPLSTERLKAYGEAATHVARNDYQAVVNTAEDKQPVVAAASAILFDAIFSSLRALAAEHHAALAQSNVPAPRLSLP